jgi:hypothetical protein
VNWIRLKSSVIARDRTVTASVLASPGTPSKQDMPIGQQADQQPIEAALLLNAVVDLFDGIIHAKLSRPAAPLTRSGDRGLLYVNRRRIAVAAHSRGMIAPALTC